MTSVMGETPAGVTSTPPVVRARVTVMVPATVPVCSATAGVVVVPAGTVKFNVRPPVENWTAGSSTPLAWAQTSK